MVRESESSFHRGAWESCRVRPLKQEVSRRCAIIDSCESGLFVILFRTSFRRGGPIRLPRSPSPECRCQSESVRRRVAGPSLPAPLLVRVLHRPNYRPWMLLLQLGTYIVLIDTGIQGAIARFVARADGFLDEDHIGGLLSKVRAVLIARR